MALLGAFKKKSTLKAAIKQTGLARENEGAKADQLFISAYQGFADVVKGDLIMGEALYNWGFALLHQAKTKNEDESIKIYLDAISRFTFCLFVEPNHLGAAIDGGVAYMDLARLMNADADDELYDLAKEFFDNAERIQRASAAYNIACIYGLRGQNEACLEFLELSKESGSLPQAEEIIADVDLHTVKKAAWFVGFMERLTADPEPEVINETVPVYDAEGNITNNKKKKKGYENEIDGVVYDAEGNVLRTAEDKVVTVTKDEEDKANSEGPKTTASSQQSEGKA